jgi:cell division protein FtsQ
MGGGVTTARRLITPRRLLGAVAVVLVLCGGWLWFRSSSLVAIRNVSITGVSGPHARQIETALRRTAQGMTTLEFDASSLRASVRRFPEVHSLAAATSFPHGLEIRVDERRPIGVVVASGSSIVIASDGTLMRDQPARAQPLPVIALASPPRGSTLAGTGAIGLLRLLQAAPWQLVPHIRQVSRTATHGIVASLRHGPSVYFGDAGELRAKWLAAVAVLSASGSSGASYVDVTDPQHPAAGVPTATTAAPATGATAPASGTPATGASATNAGTASAGNSGQGTTPPG